MKALKVIFGLELQTAKIAVDSGEFYYTLKDNETYEAICIKVAEVCGTIGESFFSEEEIKNVMSIVEPQIESQSTKNINTTNNSRNIQEITPNVVKVGSVYILTEDELAENFNYTQISEEDRIKLNIPIISWEDEPIKIELDIQAMVINQ